MFLCLRHYYRHAALACRETGFHLGHGTRRPKFRLYSLVCGDQSKRGFAEGMAYQSRLFQVTKLCGVSQALADAPEWQACNLESMLICRAAGRMNRLIIPQTTSTQELVES